MATRASDGMTLVRADLARRLDAIESLLARRGPVGAAQEAAQIVALAAEYGLKPAQRLAEGLVVALGAGGRGAAIGPWIELLRDAIRSDDMDEAAGSTWLAAVFSRLAG